MAGLDNTADWFSVLNIGAISPRVLPYPDANDMDTEVERSTMLGLTADIVPAAPATDTGNTQDDILIGYQLYFFARAYARGAKGHARSRR